MAAHRIFASTLLLALSSTLPAQLMAFDMESNRRSAGLFFWENDKSPGSVAIQYGAPEWKAEYGAMVQQKKAGTARLGKDNWTALDNSLPLKFGDQQLVVGHWYVAIHRDDNAKFHLALFDSARLRRQKIAPNTPDAVKPDHLIALQMKQVDALQKELRITVSASKENAANCELGILWGNYSLTASFSAVTVLSRSDSLRAAISNMVQLLESKQYLQFARRYAPPEVWEEQGEEQVLQEVKLLAEGDRGADLLGGLRTLLKGEIVAPEDQDRIALSAEGLPGGKIPLAWREGRWYISD